MPIHITVDRAADWVANRWLAYKEPQITEARRVQIFPTMKYNSLVTAFNISSVLLIAAVASAILFAYTAAVVFGSVAIFTRFTTEKEFRKYTLPKDLQAPPAGAPVVGVGAQPAGQAIAAPAAVLPAAAPGGAARLWHRLRDAVAPAALLRHAVNQAEPKEREDNIFVHLGVKQPDQWHEVEVDVFGYAFWRNKVPVPEAPTVQPAAPTVI